MYNITFPSAFLPSQISPDLTGSHLSSVIYNCRLPPSIFVPLCPSSASHSSHAFILNLLSCPSFCGSLGNAQWGSTSPPGWQTYSDSRVRPDSVTLILQYVCGTILWSTFSHPFPPMIAQVGVFAMALRSVTWMFARKPLRRYNPPVEGQRAAPIERPLSIPTVLLDALDLIFNLRGIGWSWSYKPFPSMSTWSTSIPIIIAKLLFKIVVFDASQYLLQYLRPTVDVPAGDTLFDPTLSRVPRCAWATLYTFFKGVRLFVNVDMGYHAATLVGRHHPLTISLAMTTAFRSPINIHLNHGLLGFPLVSAFSA